MYAYMYIRIYVYMYVCIYIYIYEDMYTYMTPRHCVFVCFCRSYFCVFMLYVDIICLFVLAPRLAARVAAAPPRPRHPPEAASPRRTTLAAWLVNRSIL